ncbi:hypothetical protein ACQPUS_17985 [Clostridium butyricum]|uniref:hypothetical protein n=1 Tax=Clostridium butyricum TaxID=1492 RepID=UPI003D34FD3B
MKGLNLKKLVAMALTLATVTAVSPVAASAAWKQDAKGWWNTEGNSWSIGWRQIDGTWYHFDETGYMSTGLFSRIRSMVLHGSIRSNENWMDARCWKMVLLTTIRSNENWMDK